MKTLFRRITNTSLQKNTFGITMLVFRVFISIQLMVTHGLKKIGIGVDEAEQVPNPLNLPDVFNQSFAVASNLIFPLFVIVGLYTRLAALPILAVTLAGYFVMHWNHSLLDKDMPFMYSAAYLLILVLGAGKYSIDHKIHSSFIKNL